MQARPRLGPPALKALVCQLLEDSTEVRCFQAIVFNVSTIKSLKVHPFQAIWLSSISLTVQCFQPVGFKLSNLLPLQRGLVAKEPISKGDKLLEIPDNCLITVERAISGARILSNAPKRTLLILSPPPPSLHLQTLFIFKDVFWGSRGEIQKKIHLRLIQNTVCLDRNRVEARGGAREAPGVERARSVPGGAGAGARDGRDAQPALIGRQGLTTIQ